jgi:hypothetical protein
MSTRESIREFLELIQPAAKEKKKAILSFEKEFFSQEGILSHQVGWLVGLIGLHD